VIVAVSEVGTDNAIVPTCSKLSTSRRSIRAPHRPGFEALLTAIAAAAGLAIVPRTELPIGVGVRRSVLRIGQASAARFGHSACVSVTEHDGSRLGSQVVVRMPYVVTLLAILRAFIFGAAAITALASRSVAGLPIGVAASVIGVVAVLRTARSALIVDERGITVRNTWRTRSWPWTDIGELGWDSPAWYRFGGPLRAISICPLRDPYPYAAGATAADPKRTERNASALQPLLQARGVSNRITEEIPAVLRWVDDPRSRRT
jgi:hypothetical protein